jgi:hypothetical protein
MTAIRKSAYGLNWRRVDIRNVDRKSHRASPSLRYGMRKRLECPAPVHFFPSPWVCTVYAFIIGPRLLSADDLTTLNAPSLFSTAATSNLPPRSFFNFPVLFRTHSPLVLSRNALTFYSLVSDFRPFSPTRAKLHFVVRNVFQSLTLTLIWKHPITSTVVVSLVHPFRSLPSLSSTLY